PRRDLHSFPTRRSSDLRKEAEEQAKLEKIGTKLNEALRAGDAQKILTVLDEVIALKPDLELRLGLQLRLPALIKLDQQDKALELDRKSTRLNSSHRTIS